MFAGLSVFPPVPKKYIHFFLWVSEIICHCKYNVSTEFLQQN